MAKNTHALVSGHNSNDQQSTGRYPIRTSRRLLIHMRKSGSRDRMRSYPPMVVQRTDLRSIKAIFSIFTLHFSNNIDIHPKVEGDTKLYQEKIRGSRSSLSRLWIYLTFWLSIQAVKTCCRGVPLALYETTLGSENLVKLNADSDLPTARKKYR
jgi:hypothetical protein